MADNSGWMPIETAPNGLMQIMTFDPRNDSEFRIRIRGADGNFWRANKCGPTHWMPLPEPPSTDPQD